MISYLLRCSGLFRVSDSMPLLICVFCLLFPTFSSPIQLAAVEVMPIVGFLLFVVSLTVKIPHGAFVKLRKNEMGGHLR